MLVEVGGPGVQEICELVAPSIRGGAHQDVGTAALNERHKKCAKSRQTGCTNDWVCGWVGIRARKNLKVGMEGGQIILAGIDDARDRHFASCLQQDFGRWRCQGSGHTLANHENIVRDDLIRVCDVENVASDDPVDSDLRLPGTLESKNHVAGVGLWWPSMAHKIRTQKTESLQLLGSEWGLTCACVEMHRGLGREENRNDWNLRGGKRKHLRDRQFLLEGKQ
mmetsp:Transcript_25987/g.59905  ORF Transcript_25987/g.59905 Transcript_25987/m.59905 type:complete len:223 (-) Transcript_25987:275-943(-)